MSKVKKPEKKFEKPLDKIKSLWYNTDNETGTQNLFPKLKKVV